MGINFIELSPRWEVSQKKINRSFKDFDVIVAIGENDKIDNHAVAEMIAVVNNKRRTNY